MLDKFEKVLEAAAIPQNPVVMEIFNPTVEPLHLLLISLQKGDSLFGFV